MAGFASEHRAAPREPPCPTPADGVLRVFSQSAINLDRRAGGGSSRLPSGEQDRHWLGTTSIPFSEAASPKGAFGQALGGAAPLASIRTQRVDLQRAKALNAEPLSGNRRCLGAGAPVVTHTPSGQRSAPAFLPKAPRRDNAHECSELDLQFRHGWGLAGRRGGTRQGRQYHRKPYRQSAHRPFWLFALEQHLINGWRWLSAVMMMGSAVLIARFQ